MMKFFVFPGLTGSLGAAEGCGKTNNVRLELLEQLEKCGAAGGFQDSSFEFQVSGWWAQPTLR